MKKRMALLLITILMLMGLAACGGVPQQETESPAADMDTSVTDTDSSVKNTDSSVSVPSESVREEKTEAELREELQALYTENDCKMFQEVYMCTFEQNGFRVTVYSFLDAEYADTVRVVCRFRDDVLLGYVVADDAVLQEARSGPGELSFYGPLDWTANEDMSHIELYSIESGAYRFVVDFEAGSFAYAETETEDALARLEALSKEECLDVLEKEYLTPLIEAGLAGSYYCDTDRITKMLDCYGLANAPQTKTETDGDGRAFAFVPRAVVLEYLEKTFLDADSYAYEYNERYDAEQDAFKIYFGKAPQERPYTVTVEDYSATKSTLSINYTVTDTASGAAVKEFCSFSRRNNSYLFDYCVQREEETAEERYALSLGESEGGGDSWACDVILTDNQTQRTKNLGREFIGDSVSDYGFFANGDVYVMNYTGLTVYDKNMDNPAPVFTTKTNFPCSHWKKTIDDQGTERYMLAIRRDPVTFEYVVIYCEFIRDEDYYKTHINDFQLSCSYRIGLLDREGRLIKSWDTGVPVMFTVFGFENTRMKKVGGNEYEMFVTYKNELRLSGRFNTEEETYTPIRFFEVR